MMGDVRRLPVALAGLVSVAALAGAAPAANGATPSVRTVAGPGVLDGPGGIALDAAGNLFVADTGHCRVLVVPARAGTLDGLRRPAGTCRHLRRRHLCGPPDHRAPERGGRRQ